MDVEKLKISSQHANDNQLAELKSLFAKFLGVANDIKLLRDRNINSVNKEKNDNLGTQSATSGNVPRDVNYLPIGVNADLGTKKLNEGNSDPEREVRSNITDIFYGNVPRDVNYLPIGVNADLGTKKLNGGNSDPEREVRSNSTDIFYGNVPRDVNYQPIGVNADLGTKKLNGGNSDPEREVRSNSTDIFYGNVPRDVNYLPIGVNADLGTKKLNGGNSDPEREVRSNSTDIFYGNVPRDVNYLPIGVNADLSTKIVNAGNSEPEQLRPNITDIFYGNVPRDVNYLPIGVNADLSTKIVNAGNSEPEQLRPNITDIFYGNVPRDVNYLPIVVNADLSTKIVNAGNSEPEQLRPNITDIFYGNVPRDVNYLPIGVNADLSTKIVNAGNSEPEQLRPNITDIFYGNVPRDVNYLPIGVNADLSTKIVNAGNSEPEQLRPNITDIFYGNVPRDVNYLPIVVNADLSTKIVNAGNSEPEQLRPNITDIFYGNVPRDVNYLPIGVNADLSTKIVNAGNSEPEQLRPNITDIFYGNVPRDVNYLPIGVNADLSTKIVNAGNSEPEQLRPNITDIFYGNVPRDVNYLPIGVNADLSTKIVNAGNSEPEQLRPNITDIFYGNVIEDLEVTTTHSNNHVMSVELPNEYSFNESRLQQILNKESHSHTINYFYYLFDDRNACDTPIGSNYNLHSSTSNFIESAKITEELIEQHYNTPHVESEVIELRDSVTFTLGSTDEATELDNVTDILIQADNESSNVDVTTLLNDLSDGSVVRENFNTSKHQSPSRNNNEKPCLEIKHRVGCDNSNMFVSTSDGKVKKYCCAYCLKRFSKLVRHLELRHKNEVDVIKFRDLPPGSKQRREVIDIIRKRGQFEWNINAQINGGELLTCRRPNIKFKKTVKDYLTCAKCFAQLSETVLRKHWNTCSNNSMKGERGVKELGRAVEGRYHADACEDLRTSVFPKMREHQCVRLIRFDWLVVTYGNDLCLNYSPHYQQQLIRTNLRKAGKVLLASKSISSDITDFSSLYHVKRCNTVIEAIRKVAHFDPKLKKFKSPGTASTLVTLMNAVGEVLLIESMKMDDAEKEKNVERFLKVFQKDVKSKINKIVAVQQAKARRRRRENIPSTDDINRLATFLNDERDKCFLELAEKFSYQKWLCLAELTMVSILLFSRRRTGEMQNISICDFHEREMVNNENKTVKPETENLIESRMKIRGKLNRPVPVLLNHMDEACLELLLLHRKAAGVPDKNECLFGLPTKSQNIKTINAGASIRTFSNLCGAQNPSSLRGTKFRKHLASFCGTLNLSDNDVTNVATFMGHDDKVHRDIYRHNTLEREVVQMSALLQAAQGNRNITTCATNIIVTKVGAELEKTQKRKEVIDLLDETSSEESSDESSDDEADVVTTKTTEKSKNNRKRKLPVRKRVVKREVVQITNVLEAAHGNRSITTGAANAKNSQGGSKLVKNQKRKGVIDLSDEYSSEESSDESANEKAEVVTIKTNKKRLNNRTKIATKTTEKGKNNQKRKLPVRKRAKVEKQ